MHLEVRHSYTKIVGATDGEMSSIRKALTYKCPWAKFSQAYRTKRWDGTKALLLRSRGQSYMPSGLLDEILKIVPDAGIDDQRAYPYSTPPSLVPLMGAEYRPYQVDACNALLAGRRGILWVPTAGGKTIIMCGIIRTLNLPTLWLTREGRLADQSAENIRFHSALNTAVLQGMKKGAVLPDEPVVVAMVQTVSRNLKRLGEWLQRFQLIISDECHACSSASFYRILMACHAPYRYGCSGTPLERSDENCLSLIAATGPVLYHATFEHVKDYLALPIVTMFLITSEQITLPWLDYKNEAMAGGASNAEAEAEATRRYWAEAYSIGVVNNEPRNKKVIELALEGVVNRQPTLVFVSRIEHGKLLQNRLADKLGSENVDYLYGDVDGDVRERMWARLADGTLPVLVCGDKTGGEGIDVPEIKRIVVASGLKAPIIVKQRIGRSMRPKEDNSRPEVFDFLDQHSKMLARHSEERISAYKEQGAEVQLGRNS